MEIIGPFEERFSLDEQFNPLYFRSQGSLWSILTQFDNFSTDSGQFMLLYKMGYITHTSRQCLVVLSYVY